MLLMKGQHLKKSYGDRVIISIDQFSIYTHDRIGIVGLNGTGKSTFIKLLAQEIELDEGVIETYCEMAYIPQLDSDTYFKEASNESRPSKTSFLNPNKKAIDKLSGGEETRFKIDKAIQKNASLLLADEPTSHLDIDGIVQLEHVLNTYKGAVVLISHDRSVLNNVCSKIAEIEDGKVRFYKGNYDDYEAAKKMEKEAQAFEYESYLKEKQRLYRAAEAKQEKSDQMKKAPSRMGPSEARLHKGSTRQKKGKVSEQSKRILKRMSQIEEKEKPKSETNVQFDLNYFRTLHAKYAMKGEHLTKAFGKQLLFSDFSWALPTGSHCAVIGGNGTGKTTLMNMIKEADSAGLTIPIQAKIGYYTQDLSQLEPSDTIIEAIKKESPYPENFIRTICARLLFKGEAVFKKIKKLKT